VPLKGEIFINYRSRGDKKCEDWKRSSTRMLFVTNFVNLYSECLAKEALDGLGDFKVRG